MTMFTTSGFFKMAAFYVDFSYYGDAKLVTSRVLPMG
jgi:hypothetical protein